MKLRSTYFIYIVIFVTAIFLFLKSPLEVFGLGCGCQLTIEVGCKEDLTKNPCPELQKCQCISNPALPLMCLGTCISDPNDPHCIPDNSNSKTDGIRTAIGCIPLNDTQIFIGWIIPKIIGIASGIAFLFMVFGVFQIITSSGDPKKTQAGKETLTSALTGLIFIILSIFLLRLIGVEILQIPGFGT